MQVYDKPVKLVWSISSCICLILLIAALGVIKKNYAEQALKYNGPDASFKTVFFLWRTYSTKLHMHRVCFHTGLTDKPNYPASY